MSLDLQPELPLVPMAANTNDYHQLPITEKQLAFARSIALALGKELPADALEHRRALSDWIDRNRSNSQSSRFMSYPTSKQVAFAEKIARLKRRAVPPECFRDRTLMSRWIDSNR